MVNINLKIDKNKIISCFLEIFIFTVLSSLISYTIFKSTLSVSFDYFIEIFLANILIWTVFVLLNIDKRIFLVISFIAVLISIIILFNNYDEFMLFANNFFNWLFVTKADENLLITEPYGSFLNYAVQTLVFLICILLYYFSVFPKFIIAFSILVFFSILTSSILLSEINFLEIYLIFIGITTVLYSLSVYRRDYKSKNSKMNIIPFFSKRLISYALISVVFISLFNLIPLNYRSIELVKKVNTFAEDVLGIPNFGDNFSNEISNQLGGDNTESDNIQFLLQNDNDNNLYLKCEVYDTYTGKSFEKSTALENSLYTDIYDRQIFSIANPAIFTQEYLSITMVDYNSNVLPVPNYFSYVGSELLDTEENFLTSSQGEVFYDKYFTDEEILISYYNFEEKAIYDYGPETEQADFYSLPSTVTDRTINLAKTFTVDDSLTNEQIATNMCVYLYQNYNYTLTPNEVKGYDFVDSFLFEHQEGYCTSFASALFVMLRAVDIPCLYVVGYTPPGNETADLYGYVEVLEKNLHSWVEVYIEGQGFVIFDPLSFSGYIQDANVADDLAENPSATSEPEATDEPEPSISPEATEIPKTSEESIENDEKLETGFNDYFIIILAVISLLLISALTYFIIKKRNNYIAVVLSSKDTKILYKTLIKLLAINNIKIKNGETVREFIKRVYAFDELYKDEKTNPSNIIRAKLIRIIEEDLYGNKNSSLENSELSKFVQIINEYTKLKHSAIMYFIRF